MFYEKALGINHTRQKQINRGLTFRMIATDAGSTRIDLAKQSGLTKMTLTNIISEFLERGYVRETDAGGSRTTLSIGPSLPKVVGLLIHRNRIVCALCDFSLNVLKSCSQPLEIKDETELMDQIFSLVDEVIEGENVLGIGVGSIGPVDIERGMILNPPQFFDIRDVPIVKYLKLRYRLPVYLNHHFNSMALAEKFYGVGRAYHDFLFLGIGDGFNLSIVTGNALYSDHTGVASEIGHMSVDFNGPLCSCGNRGCLCRYISFQNRTATVRSIELFITMLSGLCNLFNPQAIILGDEQNHLLDSDIQHMEECINQRVLTRGYRHIDMRRSFRTGDVEAPDCAINVISHVFDGELLFD